MKKLWTAVLVISMMFLFACTEPGNGQMPAQESYSVVYAESALKADDEWLRGLRGNMAEKYGHQEEVLDLMMARGGMQCWHVSTGQIFEEKDREIPFTLSFDIFVWVSEDYYAVYETQNVEMNCDDKNLKQGNEAFITYTVENGAPAEGEPFLPGEAVQVNVETSLYYDEGSDEPVEVTRDKVRFLVAPMVEVL